MAEAPPAIYELYGSSIPIVRNWAKSIGRRDLPVERVSETVAQALTIPKPRARYLLVGYPRLIVRLLRIAPTGLRDRVVARQMGLD
jgi:hypothetical protein